jgi:Helix-turn-helix domain
MTQDRDPLARRALALRALAHPLRWKLIDLVASEQSATATRCAEVLGESVASCGYHLGILAKYGYVEPVPDQVGREKPWRLASRRQDLSAGGLDEAGALAAQAATEVFLDHELERIKDRLRRQDLEPAEWQAASRVSGATRWMTAAELKEIKDLLTEIQERHGDRDDDPALRPPGAREVRVFTVTSVAPRLPGAPGAGET